MGIGIEDIFITHYTRPQFFFLARDRVKRLRFVIFHVHAIWSGQEWYSERVTQIMALRLNGRCKLVQEYTPSSSSGELALMYGHQRAASGDSSRSRHPRTHPGASTASRSGRSERGTSQTDHVRAVPVERDLVVLAVVQGTQQDCGRPRESISRRRRGGRWSGSGLKGGHYDEYFAQLNSNISLISASWDRNHMQVHTQRQNTRDTRVVKDVRGHDSTRESGLVLTERGNLKTIHRSRDTY
jgi:hypothetical protein